MKMTPVWPSPWRLLPIWLTVVQASNNRRLTLTIWIPRESSSGLLRSLKAKRSVFSQSMEMLWRYWSASVSQTCRHSQQTPSVSSEISLSCSSTEGEMNARAPLGHVLVSPSLCKQRKRFSSSEAGSAAPLEHRCRNSWRLRITLYYILKNRAGTIHSAMATLPNCVGLFAKYTWIFGYKLGYICCYMWLSLYSTKRNSSSSVKHIFKQPPKTSFGYIPSSSIPLGSQWGVWPLLSGHRTTVFTQQAQFTSLENTFV